MKSISHPGSKKSLNLVVVFLCSVFFVIAVSLSIKGVVVFRESSYDGKHRFSIILQDNRKKTVIISLQPEGQATILSVRGTFRQNELQSLLHVPIDGWIQLQGEITEDQHLASLISQFLFTNKSVYDSVTFIDLGRLYLLALKIPEREIAKESVTVPLAASKEQSLKKFFTDKQIASENKTVAIMNATGESGVGGSLERVLTNVGLAVVSVTTARATQKETKIYFSGEKSETVGVIEKILKRSAEEGNTQAADIAIIIGGTSLGSGVFAKLD